MIELGNQQFLAGPQNINMNSLNMNFLNLHHAQKFAARGTQANKTIIHIMKIKMELRIEVAHEKLFNRYENTKTHRSSVDHGLLSQKLRNSNQIGNVNNNNKNNNTNNNNRTTERNTKIGSIFNLMTLGMILEIQIDMIVVLSVIISKYVNLLNMED